MPQADGTILIDTEINADGMKAGSKEVEASVRKMASSVNDLGSKAKTSLNKQVDAFSKLNNEFAAQSRKVDELKKKVADYGKQKIPTDEYIEVQNQISQASAKMDRLIAQKERFLSLGGKTSSNQFKKYQYDIDELANTIRYAEGELKDLEDSGKAFTFGSQTKQAAADMEKLAAAERKLSDMNNRLGTSYSSIKSNINDYKNNLLKADSAQKKASESGNKLSKSLNKTGKSAKSAQFGIGKMLGTSILFSFVFQAINGAMNALASGFTNLAQYSNSTNRNISMLWSSLERLKNSLATAFAPILDVVAPILSKFIDMISTAASYVSMFFAFLSGKSTYTRAVAVQKDYAASLEDTAGSASDAAESVGDVGDNAIDAADDTDEAADAAERYLSPLDDINRFTEENKDLGNPIGGNGGSSGSGSPGKGNGGLGSGSEGPLFEEVPIDNKFASILDSIIDKLKQIRDIFMDGFWDGLGDYKPLIEELKKDLSSIGSYLKEIFTDSDVRAAAERFAESFIYNLGKIAGSFARIGLAIAVNIVGGIESFLAENVDRIKKYLVSMFDIGTEIMGTLGNLSATVSEIFSDVFSSQVAQNITGGIIGIFANIFMGVTELAASFGRDLLNLIAQPIIENKDLIKNALLSTLQPIETVIQSIETFIQNLVDKILALYNEHVKPFIDSLASGISDILTILLNGYNQYIVPVLDGLSQKFAELMAGPVGQAINSITVFLGKLIDALKLLWESVLVPFFSWIAENIIPIVSSVIQFVGENVLNVVTIIAEAIGNIADILSGIIDFIVGVFTGDWEIAWQGIQEIFEGVWNLISDFLSSTWEYITKIIKNGINVGKSVIQAGWNAIKSITSSVWNSVKNVVSSALDGIKDTASNAVNWISDKITSIFDSMVSKVSDIFDSMVDIVTQPLNWIIDKLNGLISAAESAQNWIADALSFSVDIPWPVSDMVGFDNFTIGVDRISLPRIPYLASGAVIPPNKEFMAVLGDQNQGNNIEAPESLLRRIVREETGNNSGVYEFIAQINRRTIFKEVIEQGKLARIQTGKNPFELS